MRKIMRAICGVLAFLMIASCGLLLYTILNAPAFEEGSCYTFYFQKNSSCRAYVTDTPALDKLLLGRVAGESVQYEGNRLDALVKKFHAELLFTEEACGVINYYFHSPDFPDSIKLLGHSVNLHIAVSESRTAVGTPIIFGGF